jgi:hypothetical protein
MKILVKLLVIAHVHAKKKTMMTRCNSLFSFATSICKKKKQNDENKKSQIAIIIIIIIIIYKLSFF